MEEILGKSDKSQKSGNPEYGSGGAEGLVEIEKCIILQFW